ncbi:MAG: aminotransferase class V-fold PLP-dependent enzyme [Eubacteriales bacterium]|nr:aminotransferase class V-fold PLP-dependent enzyme [Eubacteriales bacterium]
MKNCCFASDNTSGAHPRILSALVEASAGYEPSYGDDRYTLQAQEAFRRIFGPESQTYFVYNGTGSNTLALGSMLRSYQCVLASDVAHIQGDETGAPEKFTGSKILCLPSVNGKITPAQIEEKLDVLGSPHAAQPHVVSVTNVTELGTVYTCEELTAICQTAHSHGLLVHLDGSRIANAAVSLGKGFAQITRDCGVDVLSFGATKNGMVFGEAVVFMKGCDAFPFLRKHGTQLHSKMRFLSAQMLAYLKNDLWKENAAHANAMAARLCAGLENIPGVQIEYPCQANAVFVSLSEAVRAALEAKYDFHDVGKNASGKLVYRLMCGFDMKEETVDALIRTARQG